MHKAGVPLRPIVSATRAFNYNVGKFLVWILQPYMSTCSSYIRNSAHFVNEIRTRNPGQSLLASFDVVSLFTMVPVNEAIDLAMETILSDENTRNFLPRTELL